MTHNPSRDGDSTPRHWRQRATYDTAFTNILGEDDRGDLWVPSRTREAWWDRRFRWWKPTHWPAYLRSRRRLMVAFIECEESRCGR